jgi:hypothetical protein
MLFVKIALLAVVVTLTPADLSAQQTPPANTARDAGPASPSKRAAPITGKERLGDKWTDEQRSNNCKVPRDKRGTKPRPDRCASAPSG